MREELYTRRGGVYYGAHRLLAYPAAYDQPLYRFADYNSGMYASRNADSESEQTLAGLQRLAEDDLKKDLEAISGVARVTVIGGLEREIQIQVDQQKLQAHGVSILQVMQALAADNLNVPAGSVTQRNQDWTIRLTSQAQTLSDLQSIPVASNPGGSVRVREMPRMATSGRFTMGVKNEPPMPPRFEILKHPPCISSSVNFRKWVTGTSL